jgi:hypothetical protein
MLRVTSRQNAAADRKLLLQIAVTPMIPRTSSQRGATGRFRKFLWRIAEWREKSGARVTTMGAVHSLHLHSLRPPQLRYCCACRWRPALNSMIVSTESGSLNGQNDLAYPPESLHRTCHLPGLYATCVRSSRDYELRRERLLSTAAADLHARTETRWCHTPSWTRRSLYAICTRLSWRPSANRPSAIGAKSFQPLRSNAISQRCAAEWGAVPPCANYGPFSRAHPRTSDPDRPRS